MTNDTAHYPELHTDESVLRVWLLGSVHFDNALLLQRRLLYEVSGDRSQAALILCQHPPIITVGRQGSYAHIRFDREELQYRRWPIKWVNRGGGCLLHLPGQLAIYPILPLDRMGLGIQSFLAKLQDVLITVLSDFSVHAESRPHEAGVWAGARKIADIGISVRSWVSYYGAALNINPWLDPFRQIQTSSNDQAPMTSLERERHGPLSPALVRQRLIEYFAERFDFDRYSLFTDHPLLNNERRSRFVGSYLDLERA